MSVTRVLHAVRSPGPLTAAGALTWFARRKPVPPEEEGVIGYLLAPSRAEWFRCTEGTALGPGGPRDLGDAFEVCATSGAGQLRWFHGSGGHGWAVCLSEDPAALPADGLATGAVDAPERRRLEGTAERLLAGRVTGSRNGWATLVTARYPPCDVPVPASAGQEVWALLAEYAIWDGHGNVSVADTLLLSLVARDPAQPGKERPE